MVLLEDDADHATIFDAALQEARPGVVFYHESRVTGFLKKCRELHASHRVLAFVDLKLAGESGDEAVREARGEQGLSEVPMIMLSSSRSDLDIAVSLRAGANAFMNKPFSFDAFVDTLRTASVFWFDHHLHPNSASGESGRGEGGRGVGEEGGDVVD